MSLAGIGLASGASLPWVLKFLWAPLVDRLGSRRLWIRICLGLLAVTTAVLAGADPGAARGAARRAPAAATSRSPRRRTSRSTPTPSRPRTGASWAWPTRCGSPRTGARASSAARCWCGSRRVTGWRAAFLAGAALLGALARGDAGPALAAAGDGAPADAGRADPRAAPRVRASGPSSLFALLFKLDISAMDPMTKPFWVASGFSLDQIAALTTGRLLATLAGRGAGRHHRDAGRDLPRALVARTGAAAVESGLSRRPRRGAGKSPIAAAALFENFAAGLGTAAFLAFLMSVCERRYAATQFALLSAIYALSRWAAGPDVRRAGRAAGVRRLLLAARSCWGCRRTCCCLGVRYARRRASDGSAEAARHRGGGEHHEDHEHGLHVADAGHAGRGAEVRRLALGRAGGARRSSVTIGPDSSTRIAASSAILAQKAWFSR